MRNTFGNALCVTIYGESHGKSIGAVIDGLPSGLEVNLDYINEKLLLRRPAGAISTARKEPDPVSFESGVFEGKTTGTPLCIRIENSDTIQGLFRHEIGRPTRSRRFLGILQI